MAAPWEKYQSSVQSTTTLPTASPTPGPWAKYATPAPAPEQESPGLLSQVGSIAGQVGKSFILDPAIKIGKKLDSVTGAPVRAGIGALQGGGNFGTAYGEQFAKDSDLAPTGKDIALKAGVNNTPLSSKFPGVFPEKSNHWYQPQKGGLLDASLAGAAGVGVDVLADPMVLAGPLLKAAKVIPGVGKALEVVKEVAGSGAAKVGEALTGVPKKEIETYAKHLKEINAKIKTYGEDLPSAADDVRAGFAADIKRTRQGLNNQISTSLEKANPELLIPHQDIISKLEKTKQGLNPTLKADEIAHIDDMIDKVNKVAGDKGGLSLKEAFDVKNYLQDAASPSYQKSGQIFVPGKDASRAAKGAAADAREALNKVSPEIADANNQLSELHHIEAKINKNLIGEGRPEGALMGSGATQGNRNATNLERLGQLTGTDMKGEAQKLAAQRRFTSPQLTPVDTTGKSATRLGIGAGLGFLLGHVPGAAIGAAATSPAALKGLINAGAIASKLPAGALYSPAMGAVRSQNRGLLK